MRVKWLRWQRHPEFDVETQSILARHIYEREEGLVLSMDSKLAAYLSPQMQMAMMAYNSTQGEQKKSWSGTTSNLTASRATVATSATAESFPGVHWPIPHSPIPTHLCGMARCNCCSAARQVGDARHLAVKGTFHTTGCFSTKWLCATAPLFLCEMMEGQDLGGQRDVTIT